MLLCYDRVHLNDPLLAERSTPRKYTLPTLEATSPTGQVRLPLSGLWDAFATLPDPRRRRCTYSLPALLTLASAALLSNQRSVLVIAEWGQRQPPAIRTALGLPPGRAPD